jgi:hypothetical protein
VAGIDVFAIKADRLAEPQAAGRQQPEQRLVGGGHQWRAQFARGAHQANDLL